MNPATHLQARPEVSPARHGAWATPLIGHSQGNHTGKKIYSRKKKKKKKKKRGLCNRSVPTIELDYDHPIKKIKIKIPTGFSGTGAPFASCSCNSWLVFSSLSLSLSLFDLNLCN
jgi:hypothetical protein